MFGSLVVVSVASADSLLVVSIVVSVSLPAMSVAVSLAMGTSLKAPEVPSTSPAIVPICLVGSPVFDLTETSDGAMAASTWSFRLESVANTHPVRSAISATAAAAQGRCRRRSRALSRGERRRLKHPAY